MMKRMMLLGVQEETRATVPQRHIRLSLMSHLLVVNHQPNQHVASTSLRVLLSLLSSRSSLCSDQKTKKAKAPTHAFQMTGEDDRFDDEVILGTFLVNDFPTFVLFDDGDTISFVSPTFCA
ncbi:unnamed protein product [Lactuca saligna]|uniref:Uncharacterized protein n=1 Tax=Lactuca saligna TaxID=75948 RepID=A0AA36DWZ9_LACSI|nr:unnamed protein product [Lactuca saligna]